MNVSGKPIGHWRFPRERSIRLKVPGLMITYSGGVTRVDLPWLHYHSEHPVGELLCRIFQGETLDNISQTLQIFINNYPHGEEPYTPDNIEQAEDFIMQALCYDDFPPAQVLAQGSFIYWMERCRAMDTASMNGFLERACELADEGQLPYLDIGFFNVGQFLRLCFNNYCIDLVNAIRLFITTAAVRSGTATREEKGIYDELCSSLGNHRAIPEIGLQTLYNPEDGSFSYIYRISSFLSMAVFEFAHIEESKMHILRCQNPECRKFFVSKKSDAKYCGSPAPQNESRPCNKYYPQIAHQLKTKNSEMDHLIKNAKCRLYTARKRHPEDFDRIDDLISRLAYEAPAQKEKVQNNDMTLVQFKEWMSEAFRYKKGNNFYE